MAASGSSTRLVRLVALFFSSVFASGRCGSSQVPLLMWSSDDGLPPLLAAPPAAGHITSSGQLSTYLDAALGSNPRTVLLFLQEKLSKDDFTVFGGVFGNKQDSAFPNVEAAMLSSSSSLVLPALAWSASSAIPDLLQEKLGVSPLLVEPDSVSQLPLDASGSNLLFIHLPYHTGSYKTCKDILHSNDEVIGKVLSIMKDRGILYTALYTGLQPSRVIPETGASGGDEATGRSLLQAAVDASQDVKPPIMFNGAGGAGPCIMLWAQTLNVSLDPRAPWVDLTNQTATLEGSSCDGNNSLLVLNYPGIILRFSMSRRLYPVSARYWFTLDTVQLQSNGMTADFLGARNIYAPAEYSFHCQTVNSFQEALLVANTSASAGNATEWRLSFTDFQIQGFGLTNGNFSYASDCAGFFTPGIWMGLITSLLMLLILTYGLHMIMAISTMDRFDDPKGPSISVPLTE